MTPSVAPKPRPLTEQDCAGLRWRNPTDHRFVSHMPSVLIGAQELPAITLELPWLFVEINDRWRAIALLRSGPDAPCPWLDGTGSLRLNKLPFLLRIYPFALLPDGHRHVLAIWDDPDHVGQSGQVLYQDGNLSPELAPMTRACAGFLRGVDALHQIATSLHQAGILQPTQLASDGVSRLYEVDEKSLRTASPEVLGQLARTGALGAAHAQLLSRHHLEKLTISQPSSPTSNSPAMAESDDAFLNALSDDLQAGAEFEPGALAP